MLVLSRKEGESITIIAHQVIYPGEKVEIKTHKIEGNRVKYGLEASHKFKILRSELKDDTNN